MTPATGVSSTAVIAALRDQLAGLERVVEVAQQKQRALQDPDVSGLQTVLTRLDEDLQDLREQRTRMHEVVGTARLGDVAELAQGWEPEDQANANELIEETTRLVEQLLRLNSTNEALATRSLLVTRYCVNLVTQRDALQPYGPHNKKAQSGASVYSRRG